jgi:16S rRNA G966 N2-methylase RsmD
MTINPKFRALIPPLAPEELAQLEANISADGCRDPLVTWRDMLIDGHNRYEICTRRNIPFKTVSKSFQDEDEAMLWMIDNQAGRRNLPDIDKISLASKKEEIFRRKAKENQGTRTDLSAKLPKGEPVHTRAESAKAAGVGERTYDAGKLILEAAEKGEIAPEVMDDLRSRKVAIHRVAKDIKETRQRAERKEARVDAAKAIETPASESIIIGDFREHADKVANGSLSLIFTDPPYDREASKMLPELAKFASDKLADGGSLICYVGQTQLPAAIDALRLHLRYWWTIACVHSGRSTVMREYGINAGWKAVLWFVKGTRDDNSIMVNDVMSGGEEKSHHDWQQSQSEAEYWINKICPQDGIVCDPFLGGGTTGAAADKLGRKWIGFEIDEENARISASRTAKK